MNKAESFLLSLGFHKMPSDAQTNPFDYIWRSPSFLVCTTDERRGGVWVEHIKTSLLASKEQIDKALEELEKQNANPKNT